MTKRSNPSRSVPHALTRHAVERYVERHRPGWTYDAARSELERMLPRAVLHEDVAGGEPIWRLPSGVLLVVRRDGVVATVLPRGSAPTNRRPRRGRR